MGALQQELRRTKAVSEEVANNSKATTDQLINEQRLAQDRHAEEVSQQVGKRLLPASVSPLHWQFQAEQISSLCPPCVLQPLRRTTDQMWFSPLFEPVIDKTLVMLAAAPSKEVFPFTTIHHFDSFQPCWMLNQTSVPPRVVKAWQCAALHTEVACTCTVSISLVLLGEASRHCRLLSSHACEQSFLQPDSHVARHTWRRAGTDLTLPIITIIRLHHKRVAYTCAKVRTGDAICRVVIIPSIIVQACASVVLTALHSILST